MEQPKITIITPSFNQGAFIEHAILSVKNQGYVNYEHIIVDNCSTDMTHSVLLGHPHVTFISEPDKGQSDALNKGFLRSTGDIIGWLNADDYYLPGTFVSVASEFSSQAGLDAIYSHVRFVDADGRFLRNLRTHRPLKWMSVLYCFIQSTSFFFRRRIITEGHLLEENLHYSMDKEFFARLLYKKYRFKHINAYYAAFRWHENQKSKPTAEVNLRNLTEGLFIVNKLLRTNLKPNWATSLGYKWSITLLAKPIRRLLVWTNS